MRKAVDIIMVNWNGGEKALRAVAPYFDYKSDLLSCNIILVDNASTDNSLADLKRKINKVILNKENLGFGKACNQAFEGSTADYILLLNPDTRSQPHVLEKLVEFLETNPQYAIVGPGQADKNGNVLKTCGRFPTFKTTLFELSGLSKAFPRLFTPAPIMTDWDHLQSGDVDHVMGSYSLIRKPVLDKIGFMDENFFVYLEDMDLSKRARDIGYKTFYTNKYTIFHEMGGTGEEVGAYRLSYSLKARLEYWRKYFGKKRTMILLILSLTVEPVLRIIDLTIKEKKFGIRKITKAYSLYIKSML